MIVKNIKGTEKAFWKNKIKEIYSPDQMEKAYKDLDKTLTEEGS